MVPIDLLQVYTDREPHGAAFNMALDEALLLEAEKPTLRFYRWEHPSLSFGYFGRFADVAGQVGKVDLVRRWTGGGIVPHGADFTYSFIAPAGLLSAALAPHALYSRLHEGIARVLLAHGVDASLADADSTTISDDCFVNSVRADVLVGGRKVAGAAQRRTRRGLLQQGSIQGLPLPASFAEQFAAALCPRIEEYKLKPALQVRAGTLAKEKYATRAWLTSY
ncbi:MAG: hypothetical protein ABI871_01410 [Chthoniobacterales bacterium]